MSELRNLGRLVFAGVALELVAATVLITAARGDWTIIPATTLAFAAVVLLLGRYQDGPLYDWVPLRLQFAGRRRVRPAPVAPDTRLVPLREVFPGLSIDTVPSRSPALAGVCFDGAGWVAVLRLESDPALLIDREAVARIPLRVLAELLIGADVEIDSAQLVVRVTASQQAEFVGCPARREVFLALRLEPDTGAAVIEAYGGGPEGAARALRRAIGRAVELLAGVGVVGLPLPPDVLTSVLADTAGTSLEAPPDGMRRTREGWRHWRLDDVRSVSAVLRARRGAAEPFVVLGLLLAELPVELSSRSFTLTRDGDGGLACSVGLRIDAKSEVDADTAVSELADRAGELGVRLHRLNGRQMAGFAATLPLGRPAAVPRPVPAGSGDSGDAAELAVPLAPGGVVLGFADFAEPVQLQLFRPLPTSAVLITATYVARLLAHRALSAGALVQLSSPRPQGWQPLLDKFPGRAALLDTGGPGSSGLAAAGQPVLRCEELGPGQQSSPGEQPAWQSSVVVLDPLGIRSALAALTSADVIVLQRLEDYQVRWLRSGVAISDEVADWLVRIDDDIVVVITKTAAVYCSLAPTDQEIALLGAPSRVDG